jgi:hypothetical protein
MRLRNLAFILIVGVLAGVLGPACVAWMSTESIDQRLSRFETLIIGLHSYAVSFGHLPEAVKFDDAGTALYTWCVTLIPFMESVKDLLDTKSSWKAPTNRYLSEHAPQFYCDRYEKVPAERIKGIVSVFIGPDTPFQIKSSMRLSKVPPDTILLVESKPNAEHWMAPGDIELKIEPVSLPHSGKGIVVGFADGEIWYLDDSVPVQELMRFATAEPIETRDRQKSLGPFKIQYRRARSFTR